MLRVPAILIHALHGAIFLPFAIGANIHFTPSSLVNFNTSLGVASASQYFTINGSGNVDRTQVFAPTHFEISTDNLNYQSTVSVATSPGKIASVYRDSFGNYTTASGKIWYAGTGGEFPNRSALAAITSNGGVVCLGGDNYGFSSVSQQLASNVVAVYSTADAFAALKNDGSLVTWGRSGGDSSSVSHRLSSNVKKVYSTQSAFAALKGDGSVVTWGCATQGGNSTAVAGLLASNVTRVFSNLFAFAALKSDGSVVTWGDANSSSVTGNLTSNVTAVYSTQQAFAALKSDGSVVTWGWGNGGSSSSVAGSLKSNVIAIYSTKDSFAALKDNRTVVTWGVWSGNSSWVSDVREIYSNESAFAAIRNDGSVVTSGGNYNDNFSSVAHRLYWGVVAIYSTASAFAALKSDGSVVTWGDPYSGGNSTAVEGRLASNVVAVYSTAAAFAALKNDGSVVTWGAQYSGGNSSAVAAYLSSNVTAISSMLYDFAAVKKDGSVVTWGYYSTVQRIVPGSINIGSGVPLPTRVYVRVAASAPPGPVSGHISLGIANTTGQAIALSGNVHSSYLNWVSHWASQNPSFTGNAAIGTSDLDGDGIANSIEFAFGGNPLIPNPGLLSASVVGDRLVISFLARTWNGTTWSQGGIAGDGVSYQIQASTNLESGFSDDQSAVHLSMDQSGIPQNEFQYQRWELRVPFTDLKKFYRIQGKLQTAL